MKAIRKVKRITVATAAAAAAATVTVMATKTSVELVFHVFFACALTHNIFFAV